MAESIVGKPHFNLKDLTGQRFGRLVAAEFLGTVNKNALWMCQCDCGKTAKVLAHNLKKKTRSCGCIINKTMEERLWAKIAKGDGCWLWTGKSTTGFGYGHLTISRRGYDAHRLVYELTYGAIPDGMFVLHTCDNPRCCRPDHLYLGTPRDNMQDRSRRERTQCKVSHEQAREIRKRSDSGETQVALAAEFGLHRKSISRIVMGKVHKYA